MQEEYVTSLPDGTLVRWKPLIWSEYKALIKQFGDNLDGAAGWLLCEATAALCFLDHDQDGQQTDYPNLYAGTIYSVGRQILELTGFISTTEKVKLGLGQARERVMADWYEAALALVCAVLHKDEEEVRGWTLKKFMHHCALVEIATGKQLPIVEENEQDNKNTNRKYMMTQDGRKIPVLTKQDLRRQRQVAENPDDIDLL